MIGYRISINNDPKDNLTWSILFDSEEAKYGNADVDTIFSVAREFVKTLSTLQLQEKVQQKNQAERLKKILSNVRLQLDFLHGLKVIDTPAPDAFVIDNSAYISLTDEAFAILDSPDCNHNNGCP